MDIRNFTYNEISFMAFGEAQAVKKDIDALVLENARLTDIIYEQGAELAELKGLPSPYDGT